MSGRLGPPSAYLAAAVMLLVVDLAFLGEALRPGMIRAPADVILATEPFSGRAENAPPRNVDITDWTHQFHPWKKLVVESWKKGQPPLWNELNGVGQPLTANMQCESFSPYLPLYLLCGDDASDMKLLAQVFLGQILMLFLARHLGWRPIVAFGAAIAFSFSSYLQSWAMHPHAGSGAFAPGIVWAFMCIRERGGFLPTAGAALAVGLSVLAGHMETTVMAGAAAVFITIWMKPEDPNAPSFLRFVGSILVVATVGLMIAAVSVVPFLGYLAQSQVTTVRSFNKGESVPFENLITLLLPQHWGNAIKSGGHYYHGAVNVIDGVFFIGRAWIILAIGGILFGFLGRMRGTFGLVFTAMIGLLIAFAPKGIFDLLKKLPVLEHMPLVRWQFAATIPLVLLGGIGFEKLSTRCARSTGPMRFLPWIVAAVGIVEVFVQWQPYVPVVPQSALRPPSKVADFARDVSKTDRVLPLGGMMPAEFNAGFGVRSLRSYDAVGSERQLRLVFESHAFYGATWTQAAVFCDSRILDLFGIRWVMSRWPAAMSPRPVVYGSIAPGSPLVQVIPSPKDRAMELFFYRADKTPIRDGDVTVTMTPEGGQPIRFRSAIDAEKTIAGPLGRFITSPDQPVKDLADVNYRGFATVYCGFVFEQSSVSTEIKIEAQDGAQPILVSIIERDGLGQGLIERAIEGDFRMSERPSALPRAFFSASAEYAGDMLEALALATKKDFDHQKTVVIENAHLFRDRVGGKPAPFLPLGTSSPRPELVEIEVDAPENGWVVLLDEPTRGWAAKIDHQTPAIIFPANVIGRAVYVPKGRHTVTMEYRPIEFWIGAFVSSATLLVLAIGALRALLAQRPRVPEKKETTS